MMVTRLTLAAATLAAGALLLTGCEPATTTGSSGTSDGVGVNCDSHGWGPLSGCDGAGSSSAQGSGDNSSNSNSSNSNSSNDSSADGSGASDSTSSNEADGTDSSSCTADGSDHGLGFGWFQDVGDGSTKDGHGCVPSSHEFERHQKITDITKGRYTVAVTWIVVKIDVTGFRECVLDLREASSRTDDHFSRRVTTKQDCEEQQVNTVYRPVGN